jgi:hypothetical protein
MFIKIKAMKETHKIKAKKDNRIQYNSTTERYANPQPPLAYHNS